jgi:hypothetical protein
VSEAESLFERLRDLLLALSHQFAKSDEQNWDRAEHFFAASKRVDQLRREMAFGLNAADGEGRRKLGSDNANQSPRPTANQNNVRKSKKAYPKYALRSDVLIKTGLSRDRRTEYEHAVPKDEFEKVVARLSELTSRKKFIAGDVLKEVKCPSYQAYLVISFLKERGLLVVPRRGLYAFRRPKDFAAESRTIWESLGNA